MTPKTQTGVSMKKGIVVVSLLTLALAPKVVGADQLTTDFYVDVNVGGSVFHEVIPTPEDKRMALPPELSNWNCTVTPAFLSKDGKEIYHNIACFDTLSHLVVGTSVVCPLQTIGSDDKDFFLRKGEANISFYGGCITHQVGTSPTQDSPRLVLPEVGPSHSL
jgi:hypothetical protein